MKKIFTLVALLCTVSSLYAQDIFVGGKLGYSSEKVEGENRVSTFEISPEIGYSISEHGSLVLGLGYIKTNDGIDTSKAFSLTPYYEHSLPLTEKLSFNLDLGLEFGRVFGESNTFGVWGDVGLEYMFNNHWSTSLNVNVFEFGKAFADGDGPNVGFSDINLFKQESLSVAFYYYF